MQVFKFGGASIKDAGGVRNITQIIAKYPSTNLLIVFSAMGKITNQLEELTWAYLNGEDKMKLIFDEIKAFHFDLMAELFEDHKNLVFDDVANTFVEIEWLIEEQPDTGRDYVYDQIVSIGELVSTKIIAAYLNLMGIFSIWTDARNYILTDNNYRNANVVWDKTELEIKKHLPSLLANGVVITQGFIGVTSENFTSTLGREGSDYSAAIFCACLNAERMTIWKDVPGVLNADPKYFDETVKIDQLSYHDAVELTYYGATVIHPKTIKPIQNKNIPLHVRSFIYPNDGGTVVNAIKTQFPIPSFIFKVNQVLISIFPKNYSFIIEENLSNIFSILDRNKLKVNTMLNSAISFSISVDYDEYQLKGLISDLQKDFKVKYNGGLELVTIRYFNQKTIDRVTENKDVLLEVKSRHTCQMVMKDKQR